MRARCLAVGRTAAAIVAGGGSDVIAVIGRQAVRIRCEPSVARIWAREHHILDLLAAAHLAEAVDIDSRLVHRKRQSAMMHFVDAVAADRTCRRALRVARVSVRFLCSPQPESAPRTRIECKSSVETVRREKENGNQWISVMAVGNDEICNCHQRRGRFSTTHYCQLFFFCSFFTLSIAAFNYNQLMSMRSVQLIRSCYCPSVW